MNQKELYEATQVLEVALDNMRKGRPQDLQRAMLFFADMMELALPSDPIPLLLRHLRDCGPNDQALHVLTRALQTWDHAEGAWTRGTAPHSEERRALILASLGLSKAEQDAINRKIHRVSEADLPIVIALEHQQWYAGRKKEIRDFYWSHYTRQLLPPTGKWSTDAVGVLDLSIDDVIARLSDPTRPAMYQVKGLVMGYVQSGKTSHFSGLIAKAGDAGYRLIIVLAGTLDILREQTQRRIDKELVGKELLGDEEYGGDPDWNAFVSHGDLPSRLGAFDWERLTNSDDDYKKLRRLLGVLEFRSLIPGKPFNSPENLRYAPAKLAVVKKVPARLNQLCDDLQALGKLRSILAHVPTLIIDDESDQASINVIDQTKSDKKGERSQTNKAIARLIRLLPRAQYVGYTATPFANVFIDPSDAEDLFPKDFIVSLQRPAGYMGVSDFFDFDARYEAEDYRGNENAFVRGVEGDNEDEKNLPRAIDAFVLAGALKLFRQDARPKEYRFTHHTMLIHHSASQTVHAADRDIVDRIFCDGTRYQRKEGLNALRKLFNQDFASVSKVRAPKTPFPASFDELKPFLSQCLSRIRADKAVRIVNGEGRNKDDTPNFDEVPVWAILVGGTKLSRGYTVEGLTVSYYRRPTGAGDTLMQMGRWFGFRQGYRDLVRLFIGRKEKRGKTTIDLYEAFGAVCRDEEALRADLRKYAVTGLRPRQVPPLVHQHMAQLPPTSRNKRFNAEISEQDFAGDWTEKTSAPTSAQNKAHNRKIFGSLLKAASLSEPMKIDFATVSNEKRRFSALLGSITGADVLKFLQEYRWAEGRSSTRLEIQYLSAALAKGGLTDWTLVLPQMQAEPRYPTGMSTIPKLTVATRSRVSESRFGAYSEPRHRELAAAMAGTASIRTADPKLKTWLRRSRPTLLLYLVEERGDERAGITVGFGVQYPGAKKTTAITWTVGDKSRSDEVIVEK